MRQVLSAILSVGLIVGVCIASAISAPVQAASPDILKRLAIVGDSMTVGYGASSPSKSNTGLLDATFNAQGRDVQTFAVNGATALRWLTCPTNPFQQGCSTEYYGQYNKLKAYQPTAVIIALGGNEMVISRPSATYANQMVQLAQRLYAYVPPNTPFAFVRYYDVTQYGYQRPAPGTVCDLPNQCSYSWPYSSWSQYGTALNATAAAKGINVIDISDMQLNKDTDFVSDHVHLNDKGHAIYYNKLNAVLQAAVPLP